MNEVLTPQEQLHLRALRLLHDDYEHAPDAIRWARVRFPRS